MQKNAISDRTLYKTPFSKAYWLQAAAEFKDTRMLVFAALMIALRVVMKPLSIPIAADLRINTAFFINAFGAAAFGPVVAIPAAVISDYLGCVLFPQGVYYPPFMLTEIAGSVIFALFFYRARITVPRVILARFCICFFVNIVLQTPLMQGYYRFIGSNTVYPLLDTVRIAKNLVLFPVEAALLTLFLRACVPPVQKLNYIASTVRDLTLTKRYIALIAALFLLSAGATTAYAIYDYNHKSFSKDYTAQERLSRNNQTNAWAAAELGEKEEDLVTVIQSARSTAFRREMTYEVAVYRLDRDALKAKEGSTVTVNKKDCVYTEDLVRGYSKSYAAKDDALTLIATGNIVADKHTGEQISIDIQRLDTAEEKAP